MEICGATDHRGRDDGGRRMAGRSISTRCSPPATPRTRVIYTASPGNPTGWIMEEAQGRALLDVRAAARHRAAVGRSLSPHRLRPARARFSLLQIAEPDDALFVVNSFSKSWAMTGWRLGWLVYPAGATQRVREADPVQHQRLPGVPATRRARRRRAGEDCSSTNSSSDAVSAATSRPADLRGCSACARCRRPAASMRCSRLRA